MPPQPAGAITSLVNSLVTAIGEAIVSTMYMPPPRTVTYALLPPPTYIIGQNGALSGWFGFSSAPRFRSLRPR